MSPAVRLGLYAASLLAVFGIGAGVGTAIGSDSASDHAPVTVVEHPPGHTCVNACGQEAEHP